MAQYIPLAALSAILMFVAWNMGEWREFVRLRTFRLPYRVILLSVFVLTVVVDLTVAVEVGIFFACFIFIYRISSLSTAEPAQLPDHFATNGVAVYKLTGALFFGAVQLIESLLVNVPERALVLDFSSVIYIDSSGEESLEELLELYQEKGIPILVYGLRQQPRDLLLRTPLAAAFGRAACVWRYGKPAPLSGKLDKRGIEKMSGAGRGWPCFTQYHSTRKVLGMNIVHPVFTLNSGQGMPAVGMGTYKLNGREGVASMLEGITNGYRLLDSAFNYENEGSVGAAVRECGPPRGELFVTSKLPGRHQRYAEAVSTIEESPYRNRLDYLDLYLIHWPNPRQNLYVEAWQAMIEAQQKGLLRSIGVCNFLPEHIERLMAETGVCPAVNQIELHPFFPQDEALAFHRRHGIATQAWSPLGRAICCKTR